MRTILATAVNRGRQTPGRILLYGFLAATALAATGLLFLNPEQCPTSYTQEQIDASNCVIGANIGLGLILMAAAAILLGSIVLAAAAVTSRWVRRR
ncbi:MAG: hypothetical protein ACR2LH_03230 [Thermoleophilaceae bacterium]